MPTKLQKLQEMMKLINEGVSRDEVFAAFKTVLQVVKDIKTGNEREFTLMHSALQMFQEKMKGTMEKDMSVAEKKMVKDCMDMCDKMCAEMERKHKADMAKITLELGMIKGDREMIIEDALARVPAQITETPEQKRDALESLKENERLDISAIKGFDDMKKTLMDTASRRVQTPAKAFMFHKKDASAQCDGSNKTFTVGGTHFGIVGVFGTSAPQIFRPIIDYTETSNGILLTSAVSAPETGQTLVIQYLK